MTMSWELTIIGFNEVWGTEETPIDTIEYEHILYFEKFSDAVDFIILNQSHSNQTCNYKLEFI
jgi:hypothetical protein